MGVARTENRKKLESTDVMYLLRDFTLKEIAINFKMSITTVHTVLSHQIKLSQEMNLKSFKDAKNYWEEVQLKLPTNGSWMLSEERKQLTKFNVKQL